MVGEVARGRGAVAAGSVATAGAAADVLRAGGNAVDAAVAAVFAATAAEPILASLGGGGFALVRTAAGEEVLVDAFVAAPGLESGEPDGVEHVAGAGAGMESVLIDFGAATQVFHGGAGSVAVPGLLAGLRHLWDRWGRLDWLEVVAPAVAVARSGVEADSVFERVAGLVWPLLRLSETGRARFGSSGGGPLRAGERFQCPELTATLEAVAAEQRRGWRVEELGGRITRADLDAYQVIEREPLRVDFRDAVVVSNPPPSFGATLIAHALEVVGDVEPAQVAEAMRTMVARRVELGPGASRGTTHVSVADTEGNVVAMSVSNGAGSGVFAPGTGVQLNNMLGEEDLHPGGLGGWVPGERIGSMMAPMVVELADGTLVAAGSGGSERIRSALAQLVIGVAGRRQSVEEVVSAPRLHWDGDVLQVEGGLDPAVSAELRAWGPLNEWMGRDFYFGGVHAVSAGPGGWAAVGDARRGGVGIVVE